MRAVVLGVFLYIGYGHCRLWPKGIVHYAISKKDYDLHSQDEIISAFAQIEKEICVKFFNTPFNYSASTTDKVLYVNNPEKRKSCSPDNYDYSGSVIDMPIGYKCLNTRDIARIVVDMLRASIDQRVTVASSYDLVKKFHEMDRDPSQTFLLSPSDRNYINAHYHDECGTLASRAPVASRRNNEEVAGGLLSEATLNFYKNKLWPLGVVMYGVQKEFLDSSEYAVLKYAMTTIELASCVVFQHERDRDAVLVPNNLLWLGAEGAEEPALGFYVGNQTLKIETMAHGAPGHSTHAINNLLRVLGVPMMSNRYDRDNYVSINWGNVRKGKEHLLERLPEEAWVETIPYDFESVTHAPANFMCNKCELGEVTVRPLQDHLWQRTLLMGHKAHMTEADVKLLNLLYGKECGRRFAAED